MGGALTHRIGVFNSSLLSTDFFEDVMLQMEADEGNGATSGTENSRNAYTWTRTGNASVSSGYYTFDGTGDYLTLASDTGDWNFLHNGSSWTAEVVVKGRPTSASNVIFSTNGTSTSNRGAALWITSAGNVRLLVGYGTNPNAIINYTSTFTIPNDGADHHLVIDYNGRSTDGTDAVRIGLDGTKQETVNRSNTYDYVVTDASFDLTIGATDSGAACYNGQFKNLRIWRDRVPYGLSQASSYTVIPMASAVAGGIKDTIEPRFAPKDETAAAGQTWADYISEPRVIDLGSGTYHMFVSVGASHAPTSGTVIARMISTDYGCTWGNPVTIASDVTYSCRNHAVGIYSGVIVLVYRKYNGATVGFYYRTSADSYAAETSIGGSLTSSVAPWGRGVQTSDGLMFTFYAANFCEVLYWNGSAFGTRRTIYDETGTAPGYNEPFAISDGAGNVVWIARRDGAGNNDFAFYQSANSGASVSSLGEVQWTATTSSHATPVGGNVVGGNVVLFWGDRQAFKMRHVIMSAVNFWADPTTAMDGTETINGNFNMRQFAGAETTANYGYPDVIPQSEGFFLLSWYEQAYAGAANETRVWLMNAAGAITLV